MASPVADIGPLSELIKAKVASLIQEQLKPVIHELEAQHQMLLSHTALLRHNHNVNDYQMTRLENLRDLEQSVKSVSHRPAYSRSTTDKPCLSYKVSGILDHDPWEHPNMGTNLREPVPADYRLIPQFVPPENATPAERAAESATLIAEAGVSARHLGVPLTMQDFPRDPATEGGAESEDPMFSSIPLFGLHDPRWRKKEGLEPYTTVGPADYDILAMFPQGVRARKMFAMYEKKLNSRLKRLNAAVSLESSSSKTSARAGRVGAADGPAAAAGPSTSTVVQVTGVRASERTTTTQYSRPGSTPVLSAPPNLTAKPPTTKKSKKKSKASRSKNATATVPPPLPATGTTSRKRSRRAVELDDAANDDCHAGRSASASAPAPPPARKQRTTQRVPKIKFEEEEGAPEETRPEPATKRRKRSVAPSPSPTIVLHRGAGDDGDGDGDGSSNSGGVRESVQDQGSLRRSTRVRRSLAAAGTGAEAEVGAALTVVVTPDTAAKGAARKRSTSGRRASQP
jgi:hypothetical protein